jgi:hypothetical protein
MLECAASKGIIWIKWAFDCMLPLDNGWWRVEDGQVVLGGEVILIIYMAVYTYIRGCGASVSESSAMRSFEPTILSDC